MSTKIYNGYWIDKMDAEGLKSFTQNLKVRVKGKIQDRYNSLLVWHATKLLDDVCEESVRIHQFGGCVKDKKYWDKMGEIHREGSNSIVYILNQIYRSHRSFRELSETIDANVVIEKGLSYYYLSTIAEIAANQIENNIRLTNLSMEMNPLYDFANDLVFFPYKGGMLIQAFGNDIQKVLEEVIDKNVFSTQGLEYFGYWDNSDPMDGLSEEEWKSRGDLWDEVMPSGIPSEDGICVNIFEADATTLGVIERTARAELAFSIKKVKVLSMKERIKNYACRRTIEHFEEELPGNSDIEEIFKLQNKVKDIINKSIKCGFVERNGFSEKVMKVYEGLIEAYSKGFCKVSEGALNKNLMEYINGKEESVSDSVEE